MHKNNLITVFLLMSLLTFPLAVFASGELPVVSTQNAEDVRRVNSTFTGFVSGTNISKYGFEYGTSTQYGSKIESSQALASAGYVAGSYLGDPNEESYYMQGPNAIASDAQGNIFVTEGNANRWRKYSPNGTLLLEVGTAGSGNGQFDGIKGIAVDSAGNIYVGDMNNHRVQKFDPDGNFISTWGSQNGIDYQFQNVNMLKIDSEGFLWTVDQSLAQVIKTDLEGNFVSKLDPQNVPNGFFDFPGAIDFDDQGNIYVSVSNSSGVEKFDSSGSFLQHFNTGLNGHLSTNYASGLVVDDMGNMIVSDLYYNNVQVYDSQGNLVQDFGNSVYGPNALAIDSDGNLFATFFSNSQVRKYSYQSQTGYVELSTSELVCETTYHYRIFASNDVGTTEGDDKTFTTSACLDSPTDLQITTSAKTAQLSWTKNAQIKNIESYVVEYKKTNDTNWSSEVSAETNAKIEGLDPESEYEFRVSSVSVPSLQNPSFKEQSSWSSQETSTTIEIQTYSISSCEDLQSIGMNPETFQVGDLEGKYVLTKDIDCAQSSDWNWENAPLPNGNYKDTKGFFPIVDPATLNDPLEGFRGELDGAGFKVSNISQTSGSLVGVFASLQGASIKNITFDNLNINLTQISHYVGGLASFSNGAVVVDNVVVNGNIQKIDSLPGPKLAKFDRPRNMSIGQDGKLYFIDSQNKVDVTDLLGFSISQFNIEYGSEPGQISYPMFIDADSQGNFYIVDGGNYRVEKFNALGQYVTSLDLSTVSDTQSPSPYGLKVDEEDNVWISDQANSSIKKYSPSGEPLLVFGSSGQNNGQLSNPSGISIDGEGNIYVAEMGNNRVQKFDSSGNYISKISGNGYGYDDGEIYAPQNVALRPNGNVIISQTVSHKVAEFSSDGTFIRNVGSPAGPYNYTAFGIATTEDGKLYVVDNYDGGVELLDINNNFIQKIGSSYGEDFAAVGGVVGMSNWDNETNTIRITRTKSNINIDLDNSQDKFNVIVVGGIIGYGLGEMSSTISEGSIDVSQSPGIYAGGLAGLFAGAVSDVHASNNVKFTSTVAESVIAGGLFGGAFTKEINANNFVSHEPHVQNSYAWGSLEINIQDENILKMIGGIAGMFAQGTLDNVFSAEKINLNVIGENSGQSTISEAPPSVPVSGLVAYLSADPADVKNNAFDATLAGTSQCFGMTADANDDYVDPSAYECVPVNVDGNDPDHFKNNNVVEPLSEWDFTNRWVAEIDEYPQLLDGPPNEGGVDNPDPDPWATTTTTLPPIASDSSSSNNSPRNNTATNIPKQVLPSLTQLLKTSTLETTQDSSELQSIALEEKDVLDALSNGVKKASKSKELALSQSTKSLFEKVKTSKSALSIIGIILGILIALAWSYLRYQKKLKMRMLLQNAQWHNPFSRLNKH